jgi:opacity protein-like surface antigen
MRHASRRTALGFLLVIVTAATARAQSDTDPPWQEAASRPIQISTFVSQGSSGSSQFGGAIEFPWTKNASVEVEVGYRRSEIAAPSSSVNLIYALPRLGRVVPYVAGGVGLEKYATAIPWPDNRVITVANYALAINAGGGVKVPVDDRWGFRSDARWFKGFGRNGQEHWRLYNGVTLGTSKR